MREPQKNKERCQHGNAGERVKKMSDTILFGIRTELLEDDNKRAELKFSLERNEQLPLTVINDIKNGIVECSTFFPAKNRTFDITKLPEVNSQKWLEAVRQLVAKNPTGVTWFSSTEKALKYIEHM